MTVLEAAVVSHPAYLEFARVVEDVIAPLAVEVDTTEVPQSHLDAIAKTGFWGWTIPEKHGGTPVPAPVQVAALELLFGACPSTGLIASQHFGPVQHALRLGTPELLGLLPALATGERIGAGAFGHVRSWPVRRSVAAKAVDGGYVFHGEIPWLSGWGVVNLAWAGAIEEERHEVIFALVDLPDQAAIATPLRLAAIQGSRTVSVRLDGLFVPAERVVQAVGIDQWKAGDGAVGGPGAAQPGLPGPLGLARAAVADALQRQPGEPSLVALAQEVDRVSGAFVPGPEGRAVLDELAVRATTAALVARGGAGLAVDDIAQVRSRAALFLQVRGLSPRLRTAQLARWTR